MGVQVELERVQVGLGRRPVASALQRPLQPADESVQLPHQLLQAAGAQASTLSHVPAKFSSIPFADARKGRRLGGGGRGARRPPTRRAHRGGEGRPAATFGDLRLIGELCRTRRENAGGNCRACFGRNAGGTRGKATQAGMGEERENSTQGSLCRGANGVALVGSPPPWSAPLLSSCPVGGRCVLGNAPPPASKPRHLTCEGKRAPKRRGDGGTVPPAGRLEHEAHEAEGGDGPSAAERAPSTKSSAGISKQLRP